MMDVLKLIYGEKVTISDRQQKTFESLLMMLEIEYETTDVGPETKRPKLETKKSKVKPSSPNHPPKRRQISFNIEGQKSMSPPLHKSSFPQSIEDDRKYLNKKVVNMKTLLIVIGLILQKLSLYQIL